MAFTYPAAPPLDESLGRNQPHELKPPSMPMSRRLFLAATCGVPVLLSADQYLGDLMAGGGDPTVEPYSTRNADAFPRTAALIFGGFNVAHPERIAAALQPTLEDYGQIYYMRYSPFGLNKGRLVEAIWRWKKQTGIRNVRFYGHSMGGMVATELVGPAQDDLSLTVEKLDLDCTPNATRDVRGVVEQCMVEGMAAADEINYHGGPFMRLGLESTADFFNHFGEENVMDAIKHSLRKIVPGNTSNKLVESQAYTIAHFNSADHAHYLHSKPVTFYRPHFALRDTVVNDDTAQAGWQHDIPELHCEARFETRHADPSDYPAAYNLMLRSSYQKAEFPTAEQVRAARPSRAIRPI